MSASTEGRTANEDEGTNKSNYRDGDEKRFGCINYLTSILCFINITTKFGINHLDQQSKNEKRECIRDGAGLQKNLKPGR
jgi:hypothetical protein